MNEQEQRLIDIAPKALEIELIGMVQDPEDSNGMCNAESVDLPATSWDIFVKVQTVGEDWDGEDCEFQDYDSAYTFGLKLAELAPMDVELQAD